MITYRSYYIVQRVTSFLILDQDKMPIDTQPTLAKARHLIDVILGDIPDVSLLDQ